MNYYYLLSFIYSFDYKLQYLKATRSYFRFHAPRVALWLPLKVRMRLMADKR